MKMRITDLLRDDRIICIFAYIRRVVDNRVGVKVSRKTNIELKDDVKMNFQVYYL